MDVFDKVSLWWLWVYLISLYRLYLGDYGCICSFAQHHWPTRNGNESSEVGVWQALWWGHKKQSQHVILPSYGMHFVNVQLHVLVAPTPTPLPSLPPSHPTLIPTPECSAGERCNNNWLCSKGVAWRLETLWWALFHCRSLQSVCNWLNLLQRSGMKVGDFVVGVATADTKWMKCI